MTRSFPVVMERSTDVPLVDVRHVLRSGSALEPEGHEGVGRLALRLLRRGAAGMGRLEMDEAIDRIGAVVSVQATSDFYAVNMRVLKRHLPRAADLMGKLLLDPTLAQDELERLQRETAAEIVSSRDDDRSLASRALRMLAYGSHAYGRPSRGGLKSIAAVTRDDVVGFLEENLLAPNLLVGVAGDATEQEVDRYLEASAARLADGHPPSFELPAPVMSPGVRVLLVDKPERTQTQMLVGHMGPDSRDRLDLALRVALTAFGGTFTSKLMREVRVERGWSYGAYASLGRGRMPELVALWTFPSMEDAPACLRLVLDLYADLAHQGPSREDVDFARLYMARSFALQRDTAPARLSLRLHQEVLGLPQDYYDTYADRVREVTLEQAREAVLQHLQARDLAIAITCTAAKLEGPLRAVLGPDASIETIAYDSPSL